MKKYKLMFAGTPAIAATILESLHHSQAFDIQCVLTQPDKPAGRGRKLKSSEVKVYAQNQGLSVLQPESLKDDELQEMIEQYQPDLMIVVAYGLIIPKSILDIPKYGCLNVHTSLLPRWRGAAPIIHAILAGDKKTGVSIMKMDPGLDTGPVLSMESLLISKHVSSGELTEQLSDIAIHLLSKTLPDYLLGKIQAIPQSSQGCTYAHKIKKSDAQINWQAPLEQIERQIRAYNPWPVAFTELNQEKIRIWEATAQHGMEVNLAPGTIIGANKHYIEVCAQGGILRILKLQRPGGKVISACVAMNQTKNPLEVGMLLG